MLAGGRLAHAEALRKLADGQLPVQYQPEHGPAARMGDRLDRSLHDDHAYIDRTVEAPWVTQQLARRYFDAWTSGDGATVAAVLSPSFRFEAGDLGPTAGGVP